MAQARPTLVSIGHGDRHKLSLLFFLLLPFESAEISFIFFELIYPRINELPDPAYHWPMWTRPPAHARHNKHKATSRIQNHDGYLGSMATMSLIIRK